MSETLQKQTVGFVDTPTKPVSGKAAVPRRRLQFGRSVKISLAAILLVGSAAAILAGQGHVTTDNAVVSAYVLSVRSPIRGQVSGLQLHVGDTVEQTTLLAHVSDERVSDEHLVDLRSELARGAAEQAAFEAQRRALIELRRTLAARSEEHRIAQVAYTLASSNEAAANLSGGAFRLELARRDMGRKVSLVRFGDVSAATADRATLDARTAETDVASQAARLAYLRARETAAAHGIFLDTGANDVSYSAQRIDEIDLRLADVIRAEAGLAAGRTSTETRLAAEERRFAALSEAELKLPARGMVWKLGVSNGERVSTGDTLAQVVDCRASFIMAAIPQRDFSSVELGGIARFRLSGETTDREGQVLSITGDASVSGDRNLAATPVADRITTAVVRVGMTPSDNNGAECLVGRTARVLLPTSGNGMLVRLLRWLA